MEVAVAQAQAGERPPPRQRAALEKNSRIGELKRRFGNNEVTLAEFVTTLGPVLLAGTNFSVLIDCCIWRVITLAFSYSCSIHIIDRTFMKQYKK